MLEKMKGKNFLAGQLQLNYGSSDKGSLTISQNLSIIFPKKIEVSGKGLIISCVLYYGG